MAADKTRLQDLEEATRKYLAWDSILRDEKQLDLTPYQVTQAQTQKTGAEATVIARIPETYQWLLVPVQPDAQAPVAWESIRLSGSDKLAVRASKKLRTDELLLASFAPSRLRMELDRLLWRDGNHVSVKQLVEDFARYVYLPRLRDSQVLLESIREGVRLVTWANDGFALADDFDVTAGRYKGLRGGQIIDSIDPHGTSLLVKSAVASDQLDAERVAQVDDTAGGGAGGSGSQTSGEDGASIPGQPVPMKKPSRFHGSVVLDPTRVGRDAGKIADEVIAHLSGLISSDVRVTLEIHAEVPEGVPDNVVRTITENCRTLKFSDQGFEKD